jgi:hypothetical protein
MLFIPKPFEDAGFTYALSLFSWYELIGKSSLITTRDSH